MDDEILIHVFCHSLGIAVEAGVEVGESSARVWPFGLRC